MKSFELALDLDSNNKRKSPKLSNAPMEYFFTKAAMASDIALNPFPLLNPKKSCQFFGFVPPILLRSMIHEQQTTLSQHSPGKHLIHCHVWFRFECPIFSDSYNMLKCVTMSYGASDISSFCSGPPEDIDNSISNPSTSPDDAFGDASPSDQGGWNGLIVPKNELIWGRFLGLNHL